MPPETLPHIFIPFFTTKTDSSGVGLSVSRYIMRLHTANCYIGFRKRGKRCLRWLCEDCTKEIYTKKVNNNVETVVHIRKDK
ncbi:MAG: hypothetical protein LBR06_00080 [Bacteroidales bacterium]|nr:hypothetical protein [Bacteroidales bacterium]